MATTDSSHFALATPQSQASVRTVAELAIGFAAIMVVLWLPSHEQLMFGPIALFGPLALVLLSQRSTLSELGLGWRGLVSSLWILPAAVVAAAAGILLARASGTFHDLYKPDFSHVGYVLWTIYQQFLLQDYFMPRLTRLFNTDAAIAFAAVLFAMAHLPNVVLTIATLVWGAVSCALFRRYRSLYILGIAQGLLGLCFAVCVPDVYVHHMRVGLGYWQYHPHVTGHYAGYHGTPGK